MASVATTLIGFNKLKGEEQMKTTKWTTLSLVTIFSLVLPLPLYAVDASQAGAEHLALATSYEQKAAAQDALIAEHTQMKQDYKAKFFVNEKVTPMEKIRKMEDHCDAIIAAAQKEKNELLEFAKWHQMRAAELQGQ